MLIRVPRAGAYLEGDMLDFGVPLLWTVDEVLSRDECSALIARIEAAGLSEAPITTARGVEQRPDIRNNGRAMIDDPAFAADLFGRVAHTLPKTMNGGWSPAGANERLRCYRYQPGQRFAPHYDGAFIRNDREESLLTLMVYLNDGFAGGATAFPDLEVEVVPKTGRALLFQHRQLHEGRTVTEGVKYAARSDVMFRR
jgi:predicted 2-oxoglutarate/Fe(II)-dependent dioxygenase YbiX